MLEKAKADNSLPTSNDNNSFNTLKDTEKLFDFPDSSITADNAESSLKNTLISTKQGRYLDVVKVNFEGVVDGNEVIECSGLLVYSLEGYNDLEKLYADCEKLKNNPLVFAYLVTKQGDTIIILVRSTPISSYTDYIEKLNDCSSYLNGFTRRLKFKGIQTFEVKEDNELYINPDSKFFGAKEEEPIIIDEVKPVNQPLPTPTQLRIQFWYLDGKNKVQWESEVFFMWLEKKGFRTVKVGSNIELVQIVGNIVKKVEPSDIKHFTLDYLKDDPKIQRYVMDRVNLFSINYLNALKCEEIPMNRDTATSSFLYYKNGVVEITKDGIKPPIPYNEFNSLVWDDHINKRDFDINIDIVNNPPVWQDFVNKLGNNDSNRVMRLRTASGYMMHTYRNPAESKVTIFAEETVNDDPQGGTGKSLCVNAINKIRKVIDIDGKSFNPNGSFTWERVNETVNLVHIDDIANGFNFESLFSKITQGFLVNQKNKAEYYLPLEKSPKIAITTNNVMRGPSDSHKRRQYNIDIYPYFSANHTPIDEYKHIFFEQWDSNEWAKFDLYMSECIQLYLKHGVTECKEVNSLKKDAIRATCITFVDWFEEAKEDYTSYNGIGGNLAKLAYLESSGQRNIKLSDKRFMSWVKSYCDIYGYGFEKLNHVRPRSFKIVIDDDSPL